MFLQLPFGHHRNTARLLGKTSTSQGATVDFSVNVVSVFWKKSYAYKRFGDKSATNHQESGGKGWVEISTCWLFMILKSKGSSFVKHLIQAISSKTGYYLLPLRFA